MNLNDKNCRNSIKKTGMVILSGIILCTLLATTAFAKEIAQIASARDLVQDNGWIFIAILGIIIATKVWKDSQRILFVVITLVGTAVLCAICGTLEIFKTLGDSIINALGWK